MKQSRRSFIKTLSICAIATIVSPVKTVKTISKIGTKKFYDIAKKEALIQHSIMIEKMFLYGTENVGFRTTVGLIPFIKIRNETLDRLKINRSDETNEA